jgi:hypothetical protein
MRPIDETTFTRRAGNVGPRPITRGIPASLAALMAGMAMMTIARADEPETGANSTTGSVTVLATPGGGIQPQAVIDAAGAIHLVSFQGPPAGGDLVYVRIEPGQTIGSAPIRINSQPQSAVAMGTIRGGQIALGREGRVHVAWNGTQKAQPPNPFQGSPMLYSRSNPGRTAFEPQRNLMQRTYGLDGGGTVAADGAGSVYIAWHGRTDEDPASESGRRVWIARSRDEGATFAPEEPVSEHPTGACPCCGMRALADPSGRVDLLFRAATGGTERGMVLLASLDRGVSFRAAELHPWQLKACPMSSSSLATSPSGLVAAWETNGQVFFARIHPDTGASSPAIAPPGDAHNRKHPALAVNARGEILLAWAEGTAWQRGGSLAWQRFDSSGRPIGETGRIDQGIPAWSLPTAVARPDGGFVVIH